MPYCFLNNEFLRAQKGMEMSKPVREQSTSNNDWSSAQAYALAVICLLVGVGAGWLVRGSQSPVATVQAQTGSATPGSGGPPSSEQMKHMADKQAAPLLARLQADPNNFELLSQIGDVYYDTQIFPTAIDYYQQALKLQPNNANVRTDMATAYWYLGDADSAINEFQKALTFEPNKANTLFNLGIVEWQGKMDVTDAVNAWEKLLKTNPNYENKQKVTELIAQAKKHSSIKPGSQAKALPE